jgi:hypothetical protein
VEARYKSGKPVSVTDFRRETELGYGQIRVVGPFLVAVFNQELVRIVRVERSEFASILRPESMLLHRNICQARK